MNNKGNTKIDELFLLSFLGYHRRCLAGEQVELEEVWGEMGGQGDMPALDADFAMEVFELPDQVREEMEKTLRENICPALSKEREGGALPDQWNPGINYEMVIYLRSREAMN